MRTMSKKTESRRPSVQLGARKSSGSDEPTVKQSDVKIQHQVQKPKPMPKPKPKAKPNPKPKQEEANPTDMSIKDKYIIYSAGNATLFLDSLDPALATPNELELLDRHLTDVKTVIPPVESLWPNPSIITMGMGVQSESPTTSSPVDKSVKSKLKTPVKRMKSKTVAPTPGAVPTTAATRTKTTSKTTAVTNENGRLRSSMTTPSAMPKTLATRTTKITAVTSENGRGRSSMTTPSAATRTTKTTAVTSENGLWRSSMGSTRTAVRSTKKLVTKKVTHNSQ